VVDDFYQLHKKRFTELLPLGIRMKDSFLLEDAKVKVKKIS